MNEVASGTRTLSVERSTSTAHRLSRYHGACGNIHGHNMVWEADVEIKMDPEDRSHMPLDLKDISDVIDRVDHACILSRQDPLLDGGLQQKAGVDMTDLLGDVIVFDGDPTCEVMAKWMAKRIYDVDESVLSVSLACSETAKYTIEVDYDG